MSATVKFQVEAKVKEGKTLMKAAKEADLKIRESCGGDGKCGKCVVKIASGSVSEPTKKEVKLLGEDKLSQGYRLACQAEVTEGEVYVIVE